MQSCLAINSISRGARCWCGPGPTKNAVQIILDAARLLMRTSQSLAYLKTSLLARRRAGHDPHCNERTARGCHQFQSWGKPVLWKPQTEDMTVWASKDQPSASCSSRLPRHHRPPRLARRRQHARQHRRVHLGRPHHRQQTLVHAAHCTAAGRSREDKQAKAKQSSRKPLCCMCPACLVLCAEL